MTDRRTYFFLGAAVAVLGVQPLIPELRWATLSLAVTYLIFAALFAWADFAARRASANRGP